MPDKKATNLTPAEARRIAKSASSSFTKPPKSSAKAKKAKPSGPPRPKGSPKKTPSPYSKEGRAERKERQRKEARVSSSVWPPKASDFRPGKPQRPKEQYKRGDGRVNPKHPGGPGNYEPK